MTWRLRQIAILASAGIGTGVYVEAQLHGLFRPVDAAQGGEVSSVPEIEMPSLSLRAAPLASSAAAYRRPVFREDRRPREPISVAVAKQRSGLEELRLQGIVIDQHGPRGFVSSSSSPEGAWYRRDQSIEGWLIKSIDYGGMELKLDEENGRLEFQ